MLPLQPGGARPGVPDRDPVVVELLQDSFGWLAGELFDMGCGQTDLGVRLGEECAGERGGSREPLGDRAGHRAFRDAVPL